MAQAAVVTVSPQECPICHKDYTDPKILPCTHLVCQKCVLSWLKTQGNQAGCPLCRQPILSSTEQGPFGNMDAHGWIKKEQGQSDFSTLVDALPTDYATKIMIESQKTLSASDVCNICDGSAALFFCLQCDTKLCSSCSKVHSKLPCASNHAVKELSSLTAEQLAADRRFPCNEHQEEAAELYCSLHEELICFLCTASTHQTCTGVKNFAASATTKRKELEDQNKRLRQEEASTRSQIDQLNSEVAGAKTKFADMRNEINRMFAELQRMLEDRQKKLLDDVEKREEQFLEEKKLRMAKLEKLRPTLAAHADIVDTMLVSAPDRALLATLCKLKSRLNDLESRKALSYFEIFVAKALVGEVCFDEKIVNGLKKAFEIIGELRDQPMIQGTLQRCLACSTVTEGTFQLVVSNVKDLEDEVTSQRCIIRNIPWTMEATPSTVDNKKYLGVYLSCGLPSSMHSWSCDVRYELRILKTTPGEQHFSISFQKKFSGLQEEGAVSSWGHPYFIAMDELVDPQSGYIKDGKVTLEAYLAVDDPEGLWVIDDSVPSDWSPSELW